MYFRERKMKAENKLFFNRLDQLPVVKAARVRVEHAYDVAKNSSQLVNSTLQLAENYVKSASENDAVKMVTNSRLVLSANKIAVSQLDKIEQKYPIVSKTPGEVWETGKKYYEETRLKKTINKIYAVKNFGVTTINSTKKFAGEKLDILLDYSDNAVDKYVVVHNEANGEIPHCDADNTYFNRVRCISGKIYQGMKYRAGEKYESAKNFALQLLAFDLGLLLFLAETTKNTTVWTIGKAQATLSFAQEQTKAVAESITDRSKLVVLRLFQLSAHNVAAVSQIVANYSSPFLPEGVEKTVMASSAYVNELRDNFAQAKTLSELRDEIIAESKDGFSKTIDFLAEFPLVSWLIPARFQSNRDRFVIETSTTKTIKVENGYVEKYVEKNKIYGQQNGIYEETDFD